MTAETRTDEPTVETDGQGRTRYTDADGRQTVVDRSGIQPTVYQPDGRVAIGAKAANDAERRLLDRDPEAERRERERQERERAERAQREAAAERLPELADAERQAKAQRDQAWDDFLAAVAADPVLAAYRTWRDAELAHAEARSQHRKYEAESRGREHRGGGRPSPRFADALRDALDEPKGVDLEFHGGGPGTPQ